MKRFWDKVNKNSDVFGIDGKFETECWEWTGCSDDKGYGLFWFFDGIKRVYKAHQASWIIHNGPINNQHVLHKCDNKKCIRPDHLFLGSHVDNMGDMKRKGRANGRGPIGLQNGSTKLTEENVRQMRLMHNDGVCLRLIAEHFGVGLTTTWKAVTKITWRNI